MTAAVSPLLAAIAAWVFGVAVVAPALLLTWLRFERWARERRRARRRAQGFVIDVAALDRTLRDRRENRSGRPRGAGRVQTNLQAEEEAWRD
jgi:hypothetical protein